MKAVVINEITPYDKIEISEIQKQELKPGWVLVRIKAFGMNHSEQLLRLEEIGEEYIKKPVIPGIECVGVVADGGDTRFTKGDKVCALMGGMGRTFDGSYAEYALLPEHHVFKIETALSWAEMGAVPETYFTAWGSLFECLNLKSDDTLLIRGATCALGYASMQIAKALGCKVIATTHRERNITLLEPFSPDEIILDDGTLTGKISGVTKVLELVGPSVLRDTMKAVDKGAIVCNTGILGGVYTLDGFDPIKEIPNGVYLTGFFSNYPTQSVMQEISTFLDEHSIKPSIGKVFAFDDIRSAIEAQDKKTVNGKIVVEMR